jgi:cell wall assembly regulator SMI1
MGKWRALFESGLPPVAECEGGEEYAFGPPATVQELEAAERALGHPLPADVRKMLAEFNGVWYSTATTRRNGSEPYQL